ncbi:hypothetical protein TWF694_007187 [Orbilia ellipsospora]|uniref:Uncharacterized protein n=1 Tax=Orbilia ellipsospora TaxID=2528407 RepID=A0AAV9XGZ8_9PEZI
MSPYIFDENLRDHEASRKVIILRRNYPKLDDTIYRTSWLEQGIKKGGNRPPVICDSASYNLRRENEHIPENASPSSYQFQYPRYIGRLAQERFHEEGIFKQTRPQRLHLIHAKDTKPFPVTKFPESMICCKSSDCLHKQSNFETGVDGLYWLHPLSVAHLHYTLYYDHFMRFLEDCGVWVVGIFLISPLKELESEDQQGLAVDNERRPRIVVMCPWPEDWYLKVMLEAKRIYFPEQLFGVLVVVKGWLKDFRPADAMAGV